ncbi:cytochrome P450 2B4-like [Mercenaria mercenaria]|uniref:cytochrome P450 2B4-like n=1 Tax=Mercenaria mercenaria TaxID=6596 RepID=UPI001E1E09F0|nr:cytochrome P450 2B4-like [Mercenaria mercenaria]
MTIILMILVLLAVYLIWYTVFRKSDLPPGPLKLPIIGNIWWLAMQKRRKVRIPVALCEVAKKHGDVIHFQVGKENIVFLQGFDAINEAFVNQADDFSLRPDRLTKDIQKQGNGVVMENGNSHRVMQSFIMKYLNSDTAIVEKRILVEVEAATDFLSSEKGGSLDIKLLLSMMVTNIIYNVLFSKRYDYSDETLHKLINNLGTIFKSGSQIDATALIPTFILKLAKNEKMTRAKQETAKAGQWVKDQVIEEIANHEATYNESKLRDFVDVYIMERKKDPKNDIFTLDRLHYVIKDLFVAGSEASSVSLNWAILYMQEYPDVQHRCQRELGEKCADRIVRLTDRGALVYLESTLLEIQRMSNVAETTLPHTTDKETSFRGYCIPKGSIVLANLLSSNKDNRHWDEPDLFMPDRFLQDKAKKNPAFIPLGLGPRRCLGESLAKKEIFLIFTNLLQRFTFQRENENVKHTFRCIDGQLTATPLPYKTKPVKRQ